MRRISWRALRWRKSASQPSSSAAASLQRDKLGGGRGKAAAVIGGFAALGLIFALLLTDRLNPPPLGRVAQKSVVVQAEDGSVLRSFLTRDGRWRLPVRPADVDPRFLDFLLAWEDQRFQSHPGVDPLAVVRALAQLAREARVVSGASTLTMQVARLIEPRPRTLDSKLYQLARAIQLEARYSKDEILSFYLTLAPYGGNVEGVRAASLVWFGKEPKALRPAEAALLVALPQSPERRRPDRFPETARLARDHVLNVLAGKGLLSAQDLAEALEEPIPTSRQAFPFHAPHLAERLARGRANEPVVMSTIDAAIQRKLEDLVRQEANFLDDQATIAVIAVENASRRVKAHVSGHSFWGAAGQVDLTTSARSPGSTLKPFIYGLALDDGAVHPQTLIDDKPTVFGDYAPRNFDRAHQGTVTVRQALQMSLNVPAVALLDRVGPVRLAATLKHAGANLVFPKKGAIPSLPLALGGVGLSLEDLTMLFVAIPNGGIVEPLLYTDGLGGASSFRIFSEETAWYLSDILRGSPLPDGWSMGQGVARKRTIGFKTGTSFGFRDAWAVGFSPGYTIGVWVGRPDGSTRPGSFGRNAAAPLLLKAFELLPREAEGLRPAPKGVVFAENAERLPQGLQRFRMRASEPAGLKRVLPPRIAFPPDGSVVSLPAQDEPQTLALKAKGGQGALRWIIDGQPLQNGIGAQVYWQPTGQGFARITVVDSEGRSDTARIRLKPAS